MPPSNPTLSKTYTKEELCLMEPHPQACGIAIFGASGDLAHRKLFPALWTLLMDDVLPETCYVLGLARTPMSDTAFRDFIRQALNGLPGTDPVKLEPFLARCFYLSGDYQDAAFYKRIDQRLKELDAEHQLPERRIFYLSTPPALYDPIARCLHDQGMAQPDQAEGWVRVVVEKPYGRDLNSAVNLSQALRRAFYEEQIYRIDHYLGKESVQNILMFRFANAINEPVWNRKYIDHIQITAAESVGVGHRAGYYEQAGVMRDMFQNHLFQLLSLVAMEPPANMEAEALRNEKAQVIQSLKVIEPAKLVQQAVRGQYQGYRQEANVKPDSTIETFAALKVEIDNWRWQGVPFYLRSGKKLHQRVTEVVVQFKNVPTSIFKPLMAEQLSPNILKFRLQPDDGISLSFETKHPGPKLCLSTATMEFNYMEAFGIAPPEAYARLFLDVMLGDPTLFARQDWLHCSWSYLDPILSYWAEQKGKGLAEYPSGSWGPAESDALLRRDNRQWLTT